MTYAYPAILRPDGSNWTNANGGAGETGPAGADGKTVRNGSGSPGSGLGVNGDFYIDTTANAIYGPKTAGAWGSGTSLIGPTGSTGPQGDQGPQGDPAPTAGESGNAIIDFGAFPGKTDASVVVTGKAEILSGSVVRAFKRIEDSADHSADEHWVEPFSVNAGAIVAGTGFTIYAAAETGRLWGQWNVSWHWV